MVKGTVSITLEDYHTFIDSAILTQQTQDKFKIASKELQVFLSFLASRGDIEKYVDEFNKQSKTSRIIFEGTSAKIEIKDDQS